MKTTPLTICRCPAEVHRSLKRSARRNHRSLNGESLAWLERQATSKPVSAKETSAILKQLQKTLSSTERKAMAECIEGVRRRISGLQLASIS